MQFRKHLSKILLIITAVFVFALSANAATHAGFAAGSDAVYFVSNTSGSDSNAGTSASAPLKTLGKAYSNLTSGGTIVICGEVAIPNAFAPSDAGGTVIYTSVYGGVNYAADHGAKLVISANMAFANDTFFENCRLYITQSGLIFSGRYHNFGFGRGITVYDDSGVSGFVYPTIIGGYNGPTTVAGGSSSADYVVYVKSGTWNSVYGGNRRSAGTNAVGKLSGDVSVIIVGGTFKDVVSATGMNVHTGRVYFAVTGGTFDGKVIPIKRIGTISSTAACTTAKYNGKVLVRLTGGTYNKDFRVFENNVADVYDTYPIYSTTTVVVKGGTYNGGFYGYGILGSLILKYDPDVLAESKIDGFPHVRTATLTMSSEPTELTRFSAEIGDKADPYVVEKDNVYYYCFSSSATVNGTSVPAIKAAAHGTIAFGSLTKQMRTVFTAADTTISNAKKEYWAPELHYFDADTVGSANAGWYIYFAADNGDNENHRMYVLRATDPENPLSDYEMVGKITDSTNCWAIDGTVLQLNGSLYFVWSGWEGTTNVAQNIYIAKMSDPWTISSSRVCISSPTYSWETVGSPDVNEGPQVLQYKGSTHIVYSASGSWDQYYCYGILTLTGSNPLSASSWTKSSSSVFSSGNGVYGPGHGSFVQGEDGEWFMIYHANPSLTVPSDSSWWAERNVYAKKFTFTTKTVGGVSVYFPNFGSPASATGSQYAQLRTADYHADGDHMWSAWNNYFDGDVLEIARYCFICGEWETQSVTMPTMPAFTTTQTASSVKLTWTTVDGVDGYKIWRKAAGETEYTVVTAIHDATATTYTDSDLSSGVKYTYVIRAFYKDRVGTYHFSSSSGAQVVYTKPTAPEGTVAYDVSGGIKVTITSPVTCTGYVYCRSDDNDASYSVVKTTSSKSFIDTNVAVGSTYYYRVYAYAGDVSVRSDSTLAGSFTAAPKAVEITSITYTDAGVVLKWDAVDDVDGYKVFYKVAGATSWSSQYLNALTYTHTTAVNGTTYTYAVQCYKKVDGTAYYSQITPVKQNFDVPVAVESGTTKLLSIKDLNTSSVEGSHASDNYKTAALEINYRETVDLNSTLTGYTRYDTAWYPRIKKVNDDLYVLFFMYGQYGQHLYYATSTDGQTWGAPNVLWNSANHAFTYTYGSLEGTEDRYYAVNADACVLDNGEILCVFAVRPNLGYNTAEYIDLNGIYMTRGTVQADNTIKWSSSRKIYTGQCWEPFIRQRDDGLVEVYWSCVVGYIELYGFDVEKRSTCTAMITSSDNGATWIPDIQPGAATYVATRIFQQAIGNKVPYGDYTTAVPYFGGQMPSVVTLYNGKSLVAVEVADLNNDFTISLATSEADGVWKELGLTDTGPSTTLASVFDGAAPYLARFPSGEVYLTYNTSGTLYGRMVKPNGTAVDSTAFVAADGVHGCWGSSEVVGSHEVITAAQSKVDDKYGIHLVHSYLNHRINAPTANITVGGCTDDWEDNTDALFVGSVSQAQVTLRAAHDEEYVYFLISRLDEDLQSTKDFTKICIGVGTTDYYQLIVYTDGSTSLRYKDGTNDTVVSGSVTVAQKVFGTLDDSSDTDEGAVFEVAVPKSLVELTDKTSFKVRLALDNTDGTTHTTDTFTGVSTTGTSRWPSIVLD